MTPIRVFVVDDSDVFVDAVRDVLDACPDFELVGEAHSGEAALPAIQRSAPDLVLVDLILPGIDGLETCRRLTSLAVQPYVILCSAGEDPRAVGSGTGGNGNSACPAAFVPKARISPAVLRAAWARRPRAVGALN